MEDEFEKIPTWKMGMEWDVAVSEMHKRKEAVGRMGGKERVERQHSHGKLTVRERIEKLVDKDSFFEAGSLMGTSQYDENNDIVNFIPTGYVTGLAEIDGRPVTLGGEDFTVRGGSEAGKGADFFMQPLSIQYGVPAVYICDGAGANAANYEKRNRMYLPASGKTWWWCTQTLLKVPVISAVMGSIAGGVAARACLSHFSIMVKGTGQIFPGGPPVVERAYGYQITKEELGGTWLHCCETGVIDNEAKDEADCFRQIRQFLSYMPDTTTEVPQRIDLGDDPNRREEELLTIIPKDPEKGYDMYKLIRLIVDKGEFFEIRKGYGPSLITALARMDGYVVGVLAGNPEFSGGAVTGPSARKMARFIDLCNFFNIPLMLLVDVSGFDVGLEAEKQGAIRCAAHALMSAAESNVPKVQFNLRKAHGMASGLFDSIGGALNLKLRLGWPSGDWRTNPVECEPYAAGSAGMASALNPEAKQQALEAKIVGAGSPFHAAEAGEVVDIIDPRDTRSIACRFFKAAEPSLKKNAALLKPSVRPW
ncbi:acyl-CoA carboxylase subunit beta [Thermodesulfobacteriota bacterium]